MEAPVTREQIENANLNSKIQVGKEVVKRALREHNSKNVVIGFTGGKDSTAVAWFVKKVCEENGLDKPRFMFLDHGQHFDEMEAYVEKIAEDWGFETVVVRNDNIIDQAENPGDYVDLNDLNDRNVKEAKRIDEDIDQVQWLMDTEAGNHLLKTVPMNEFIEEKGVEVVINGVRWDEHESREDEEFYSPRYDSEHVRVHPILQFTERDIWDLTWHHIVPDVTGIEIDSFPESVEDLPEGLEIEDIPISPKYWKGFRSLGSEVSTKKSAEEPAWLQDLENTTERAGRAQNKDEEEIMNRLREMGYM